MKTTTSPVAAAVPAVMNGALSIVDFVRADAGIVEAVQEARRAAVFTAYYHMLVGGNSTQLDTLKAACKLYSDVKECKTALKVERVSPAVKRMQAVYVAYGSALETVGIPKGLNMPANNQAARDARHEACALAAEPLTAQFIAIVAEALKPVVKAKPAKKETEAKTPDAPAADAPVAAATDAPVADDIPAASLTLADMVRVVANAARSGMLDADSIALLDSALDSIATAVTLEVTEVETAEGAPA